jgi:heptosyltransferase-3
MHIIINRTDAIGDVCLTLPAIGWIKHIYPDCKISMLVSEYAAPLAQVCHWVDHVAILPKKPTVDNVTHLLKELSADCIIHVHPNRLLSKSSKLAGIPQRIGVFGRWHHWIYCNQFIWLSRSGSQYHESYLNLLLIAKSLNFNAPELSIFLNNFVDQGGLPVWQHNNSRHIILHPFSRGSGREWPVEHFASLAHVLIENEFMPVICGTTVEGDYFKKYIQLFPTGVVLAFGEDSLSDYITRIKSSAGLVASSTGPLHIASMTGCPAFGIFPPRKGINSVRWGGIGPHAINFEAPIQCETACSNKHCACMSSISAASVFQKIIGAINVI